ncbi:MAG TPA: hypothetical protein VM097_01105 [Mycobacteriales bacterium]|nr:hypothetical protein [Mycobacteriales bacterium]
MLRAALGIAAAATLAAGGSIALADPGPNGHNDYGLCKAYFAGSENGREHKHGAPPFVALEAAAEAADQSMEDYCAATTPGGK